ncbi:hypothetical protein Aros01_05114 [Streptosporangium roseum]|uniref:Uncharacterized protein n=1 Tax=Streptosporangium roseum (strain ATCC 12428 / DSM 43021 / JCM 3005 / KCTC 9067 / NCIMB 10171 / NRRL 2505 / NI 9100) TaxID=479432 RepID=D2BAP9_STRRD|nr:hypothetical protein Sros_7188 [Streptosporangium roseum DSM 43021]
MVLVRATTMRVAGRGSHYVPDTTEDWPKALGGFWCGSRQ